MLTSQYSIQFQFISVAAHGENVQYRMIKNKKKRGTKIHVATYAISQTETTANMC